MREVSTATAEAWQASAKIGTIRPCARLTIQKLQVLLTPYDRAKIPGGTARTGQGTFASMALGQRGVPRELPNVRSVKWNRSLDADTADCTITLWNTKPLAVGGTPEPGFETTFDNPGWYAFDRSSADADAAWGITPNDWQGWIMPDRCIRTYEGWGFDATKIPEKDPNLYLTGVWLIDDVDLTHDGFIEIRARDLGRVLIEEIMFPPVVPFADYPLQWSTGGTGSTGSTGSGSGGSGALEGYLRPIYSTDSNQLRIGGDFFNSPIAGTFVPIDNNARSLIAVGLDGSVQGHHGVDAFDSSQESYWLAAARWAAAYGQDGNPYPFIEGTLNIDIDGIYIKTWGGPYTAYISLKQCGEWIGGQTFGDPHLGGIPFVMKVNIPASAATAGVTYDFGQTYVNVTAVRVTFTNFYWSGQKILGHFAGQQGDQNYNLFYVGVKDIQLKGKLSGSALTPIQDPGMGGANNSLNFDPIANYSDYTDICMWLLAWGGFYWPDGSFVTLSDGSVVTVTASGAPPPVPYPPGGRLWGDFMRAGTAGIVDLGVELWDQKPLMDGIRYIADILGFQLFIDEGGGAVWRLPNYYAVGSYQSGVDGGPREGRTSDVILIDEATTLLSLKATVSSRNVREQVFIANVDGSFGAVAQGFNPAPSGLRRVGGWSDSRFESVEECQIMAELIAVRQMFEYRKNSLTIAANPAIQIDDQLRIQERTTAETYLHYVRGISSENDMTTGKWTYGLTTNWLGNSPTDRWAVDMEQLSDATKAYLNKLIGL